MRAGGEAFGSNQSGLADPPSLQALAMRRGERAAFIRLVFGGFMREYIGAAVMLAKGGLEYVHRRTKWSPQRLSCSANGM